MSAKTDSNEKAGPENDAYFCYVCGVELLSASNFDKHRATDDHRINYLNRRYRGKRLEYLSDKNGVSIDVIRSNVSVKFVQNTYTVEIITGHCFDNLKDDNEDSQNYEFTLRLFYKGDKPILLLGIEILNMFSLTQSGVILNIMDHYNLKNREVHLRILPGRHYDVKCEVITGPVARNLHIPVIFEIVSESDINALEPFYVGKTVEIKGVDKMRNFGEFIPGAQPGENELNKLKMERPLRRYEIPGWFQTLLYNNDAKGLRKRMGISPEISPRNYHNFFTTLLWMEELQLELDIQYYGKKGIVLSIPTSPNVRGKRCVALDEEGLSENRPSILYRDEVQICQTNEREKGVNNPQWYQGFVHKVELTKVYLGMDEQRFMDKFVNTDTMFDLEFCVNRFPVKVCHRAVSLTSYLHNFLFPKVQSSRARDRGLLVLPSISTYDANIRNNPQQLQAIRHIVAGTSGNCPYVIFGPPGTGKTVTVVEAIKQVLFHDGMSHVLACAPSNTATDVIAERLLDHFDAKHVIRLYAESRVKYLPKLSNKLKEASNYNAECESVFFPSRGELMTKRVIVCTFVMASKICGASFPERHFTHVFLDEVGHSTECEAVVALGGILLPEGQLVLAGDPHQLGPVVRNTNATSGSLCFPESGLDTSLLERIMSLPPYKKTEEGSFNPNYVTKLVKNYRSHPSILKIPNDLFYSGELEVCGNPAIINYFKNWRYLPKQEFPVVVHSVDGEDQQEKYSPSFHNSKEVMVVMRHLTNLLEGKPKIKPEEIGIITPYRLQVEKIREKVRQKYRMILDRLKIGSVEDFQGEERKVIIISTVRATREHLAMDDLFKLGFLRNPKRFNVAVTRAQCLLIVVCCPAVLSLDRYWKSLIKYVLKEGGYTGVVMKEPSENIDEVVEKAKKLDNRPIFGHMSARQIVDVPAINTE